MTTKTTNNTSQKPKEKRCCPDCNWEVDVNEVSCHSCHSQLYKNYGIAVLQAYLWAGLISGIALIPVYFISDLFKFHNETVLIVVFGVIFMGTMSQKKAALLARRDLAVYRPNSQNVENKSNTATGSKEVNKPFKLNEKLSKDPKVIEFFKQTYDAWIGGKLDGINMNFHNEAKSIIPEDFMKKYSSYEVLETFFTDFPPMQSEFLIGWSNAISENVRGWFVLTNLRLIIRDGVTLTFHEVKLREIVDFKPSQNRSVPFVFNLKSGISVKINIVNFCPKEEYIHYAIHMNK